MPRLLIWILGAVLCLPLPAGAALKPRIAVLTDISPVTVEPDDFESMIRLLVHADLFEIEALIATTGWSNGGGQERPDILHGIIDAYEKDLGNLRRITGQQNHLDDESAQQTGYWPSPAYLHARTVTGSAKRGFRFVGEGNNSDGSDLLIRLADEPDERPLWVQAWGGANTLAQAIWKVRQERTPDQLKAFLRKLRVYTITDQDGAQKSGNVIDWPESSHQWMRREFGQDLFFVWDESAWKYQNGTGRSRWSEYASQIQGHGHLGDLYPAFKYGVEGDSPAFLYVQPNGLNEPEHPDWGSWGGYFRPGQGPDKATQAWVNQPGTPASAISRKYESRFYQAIFNNFSARMNWAKNGAGNRNPVVIVNGDNTPAPLRLSPAPGATITLDASGSRDPDGDKLQFAWWMLPEAGTYGKEVAIANHDAPCATLGIPADAAGKSMHVICEVTDEGSPPLTSYRRIILEPAGVASASPPGARPQMAKPRVVILSDFPPLDVIPGGRGDGPPEKRSDPDDLQSMVRFLLYANEFDVEGLVASAATFANIARKQNILDMIGLYDQVDGNLKQHDARYPAAEQLRAVTWQGRDRTWGKPAGEIIGEGRDSEASEALIAIVDRQDPRPVWVCVWGGPCDLAQAIWKVQQTRSKAGLDRFIGKLRIFMIGLPGKPGQDGSGQWMLDHFPDLFVIVSQQTYSGMFAHNTPAGNLEWINANVREGHGPLGAAYPECGFDPDKPGVREGDSPSFLYLVSAIRGMNDPGNPGEESWGGQYQQRDPTRQHWYDGPGPDSVSRWLPQMQLEFLARMDWCLPLHPSP